MNKVTIVGSGVAGLATATRLIAKGYDVSIFESAEYTGGKIHCFNLDGYRFDAGPSLFTLPHLVDDLFKNLGENPRDFFNYDKKDIHCEYFWNDGKKLTAYSDTKKYFTQIYQQFGVDESTMHKYLKRSKRKYELTQNIFHQKSQHKLSTYLSIDILKAIPFLRSLDIFKSLNQTNQLFLREPHLVQLYNRYATYNGSNPYETPGIMSLIQHIESHYGTWVPKKGMVEISKSLTRLLKKKGAKIYLNSNVDEIITKGNKAIGVLSNGKEFESDYVVSNMDIFFTYKKLLKNIEMPKRVNRSERSSSAVIFYWGINRVFDQLDLHNILFSENYQNEFETIFKKRELTNDPTIYINITSKDIPADAPKGCENWFVMINAPYDCKQNWERMIKKLRKNVINKINKMLKVDIEKSIQVEKIYTPKTIETMTQSHLGSLYGTSSNSKLSAFLRHPNFTNKINNLFFTGGSVHPGGGIPLCLMSAKIVANEFKDRSNVKI